jgi:DNA-binding transcriptional LysR family regulator
MSRQPAESSVDVELRSWQQFLMLAKSLHFGRAARQLGMTQPPLTQAIQKLEARLGLPLFERTRRSVRLLPAGAALVEPVTRLLETARALPTMAHAAANGKVGVLRLGFVSTVGYGPLPRWLQTFRAEFPDVAVQLSEATFNVQIAAFAEGKLDAGFILHAPGASLTRSLALQRLSVGIEPLMLALPDSTAPSMRQMTTADLRALPLIIFPRDSAPSLYDGILAFYHRQGIAPRIAQEATQMQTIVNLVSAGLGIALVPKVIAMLRRSGVVYRRLPATMAKFGPRCETSLVWSAQPNPVVERFVEHISKSLARR